MSQHVNPNLLKVDLQLGGYTYQRDLALDVAIESNNPAGLNKALAENPAKYSWWAALSVKAATLEEEAENRCEKLWAELYSKAERELTKDGKLPKVEAIKSAILRTSVYQTALAEVVRTREAHGMAKMACKTLDKRQDSLMEIARNMRGELNSNMRDHLKQVRDRIHQRGGV